MSLSHSSLLLSRGSYVNNVSSDKPLRQKLIPNNMASSTILSQKKSHFRNEQLHYINTIYNKPKLHSFILYYPRIYPHSSPGFFYTQKRKLLAQIWNTRKNSIYEKVITETYKQFFFLLNIQASQE